VENVLVGAVATDDTQTVECGGGNGKEVERGHPTP
jgi:hypothetical protein